MVTLVIGTVARVVVGLAKVDPLHISWVNLGLQLAEAGGRRGEQSHGML